MKTIWKYVLAGEVNKFDLPAAAEVVFVGPDPVGQLAMWVALNPAAPKQERTFQIFGTGHPIPNVAAYIGSALQGPFVWHVYEVAP